jgi:hypothetical protein
VYDPASLTNLHLAYPGQSFQIEVFAPDTATAKRLVREARSGRSARY